MFQEEILRGRVALVTGASRGIGQAIALGLTRAGANLIIVGRTSRELDATSALIQRFGREPLSITTDVSNRHDVDRVVLEGVQKFGHVDILVNNAGRQPPIGPLVECEPEDWLQTIKVNLLGPMLCCKAVLPHMMERRQGKIINLSGGGATAPRPNFSAYAASKAAVVRFTETLAEELKPFNIQVNAIAPGAINTRMLDEVLTAGEAAGEAAIAQAKRQKETGGDSLEAAVDLAVFMASDASGTLTGKLISAQHDPWREWAGKADELNATPLYTIRRLDSFTIKPLLRDLDY
jgi:3-oxoacyl-[acyl-carrier protein] reductase